jgi:transcription initiation factor TFIIF subunit alpha
MPASSKGAPAKPAAKPQPKTVSQQPNFEALRQQNGGWSFPLKEGMVEFDLVLTKRSTKALRSHVMRLVPPRKTQEGIDPSNQDDFTRPVLLHRRDPRQPPPGRAVKELTPEETPEQVAEKEKLAQLKAERDAQRAIDDAQKAPTGAPAKKQPKQKEKPQGTKVSHGPRTEQQKKESELRYEEALPWHLEDADGKNVWVGQYEAPLSDTKVALMFKDGRFSVTPLEKYYKFTSKRSAVNALTIDQAEAVMKKKAPVARWAMRDAQREQAERAMADSRTIMNGGGMVKLESRTYMQSSRREKEDHDDIDMSADEFQDDDENAGLEPERDEDSKESKDKIRRDQLRANLFGDGDERIVEKEEEVERKEENERKVHGKKMKKSLKKRDKQFQYDDSDDSERERDPFASSVCRDLDTDETSIMSGMLIRCRVNLTRTLMKRTRKPRRKRRRTRIRMATSRVNRPREATPLKAKRLSPRQRPSLLSVLARLWSRTLAETSPHGRTRRRRSDLRVLHLLGVAAGLPYQAPCLAAPAVLDPAVMPKLPEARCRTGLEAESRRSLTSRLVA